MNNKQYEEGHLLLMYMQLSEEQKELINRLIDFLLICQEMDK